MNDGVTIALPHCEPDHPYAEIETAALARGACPRCGGILDGEKSARMIRARRLGESYLWTGREDHWTGDEQGASSEAFRLGQDEP